MIEVLELAPEPPSVARARRWSADLLARHGVDASSDTVLLLVSELVSNAVVHAGTACTLRLSLEGCVRVEVRDGSDALPDLPTGSDPLATSGRGLHLVRALSTTCGVQPLPGGGKQVWFELPLPGPVGAPERPSVATA